MSAHISKAKYLFLPAHQVPIAIGVKRAHRIDKTPQWLRVSNSYEK